MFVLLTEDKDDILTAINKLEKSISIPKNYEQIQSCKKWLKVIEKQVKNYCSREESISNVLDVLITFTAAKNSVLTKITNYEKGVKNV